MTASSNLRVFTIPPHKAFADALVDGLIASYGQDPMGLARGIIIVPNNRAATAIRDAFVRQSSKGLLLPRLVAIGDPELGENIGLALDTIEGTIEGQALPPAIDPLHRQLILARMLQQSMAVERLGALDGAQAMRLAADLARVLDQLTIERVPAQALKSVDVSGLSDYWDDTLKLLTLILDDWPQHLASMGCIDNADRRNRQLERVAKHWRDEPPPGFVIAAGISTTAPAIMQVVRTISRMERGAVVLAGLDLDMAEDEWDAIRGHKEQSSGEGEARIETHPQFHMIQLLDRIDVSRGEVGLWDGGRGLIARERRSAVVATAMAPATFTEHWAKLSTAERKLDGVTALELATPFEEAQSIALMMREAIETPGQTAALVTPDRLLAERVSAHLQRWGVTADDSAGKPLSATLPGTLMLALAQAVADHFHPVSFLTLIKHPLVQKGEERLTWLDQARDFDMKLRGPRPAPHLAGLATRLGEDEAWTTVYDLLGPLEQTHGGLVAQITALKDAATRLAGDAVWSGQDGRALSTLIADLEVLGDDGPCDVSSDSMPHLLRGLMDGIAIRPAAGGHPRLFIWGLLEAKLQSADVMILGSLNETTWPQLPSPDPWLAPAIRRQLGLPGLERRIGLSAHDLVSALGANRIIMTRAKRDERSPTIASRFWLRLETLAGGFAAPKIRYDLMARVLDEAKGQRAERPAPNPAVEDRPNKINVTAVDGLKADPFAFYAKTILRLSSLEAPGEAPDAKWRGTFLHAVLERWGKEAHFETGSLLPLLQQAFDESGLHPLVKAMWQPRFEDSAAWFEAQVDAARAEGRVPIFCEEKGTATIAEIKVTGKPDRIDRLADQSLAIVDYKTGAPPSDLQVKEGYALQLGLLGALAERGAFAGVEGKAQTFEYWSQQRNGAQFGSIKSPTSGKGKNKSDAERFVADMVAQFTMAAEHWLKNCNPFEAKCRPDLAYSEFDQLMRYEEWQGRDG
jgi:ATP-dependent helicase/nuclease subunit B